MAFLGQSWGLDFAVSNAPFWHSGLLADSSRILELKTLIFASFSPYLGQDGAMMGPDEFETTQIIAARRSQVFKKGSRQGRYDATMGQVGAKKTRKQSRIV